MRERHHGIVLQCEEEAGAGFEDLSLVALNLLSKRLDGAYEKVGEANVKLRALLNDDDAANDTAGYMEPIDDTHRALALKIAQRIATLQVPTAPPPKQPEPMQLKRPFDKVGEFNGTHANWPPFRDLFTALIIDQQYEDLERFLLLREACKGPAAGIINGYPPQKGSFALAWEGLTRIFEDKHAVTQALIDRMIDLPPARTESTGELRRVIDTITSTQRQLNAMGYQCDHWAPLLMNLLARKLPKATMGEWEQARQTEQPPGLTELITFLESRARMRVFSADGATQSSTRPGQENRQSGGRHYQRSNEPIRPLRPHNNDSMGQGPERCPKCNGPHALFRCSAIINMATPHERRQALIGIRACYNCLGAGHMATNCPQGACMRCNLKHHRLLCPAQDRRPPPTAHAHHATWKRARKD